jgi:hypothetical protein
MNTCGVHVVVVWNKNARSTIASAATTWAFRMGIGYQVALTILVPTVVLLAGFLGLFFMLRL